mgnify:CR=1 FL=1
MAGAGKGMAMVALGGALLLGGCNAQSARDTGGAIGTLFGAVAGAAIGSHGNMGAAGGALFGGMVGFIVGSFAGQVIDDADRARQQSATQAALNGDGTTVHWISPKTPATVYGRTEILQTVTVPVNAPASVGTVVPPARPYDGPVVYCDPGNAHPYRLEARRCPSNGRVQEISRERYLTMVPEAADQPALHPAPPAGKKAARRSAPASAPVSAAPAQPAPAAVTVCKTAREVIYVDGKETMEQVEYCRAPGAVGWSRRTA